MYRIGGEMGHPGQMGPVASVAVVPCGVLRGRGAGEGHGHPPSSRSPRPINDSPLSTFSTRLKLYPPCPLSPSLCLCVSVLKLRADSSRSPRPIPCGGGGGFLLKEGWFLLNFLGFLLNPTAHFTPNQPLFFNLSPFFGKIQQKPSGLGC